MQQCEAHPKTADVARGHWREILINLGIDGKFLTGKNTACPVCGGKDRFRFVDYGGDGVWICNHCGTYRPYELLKRLFGWDFASAMHRIDAIVGNLPKVAKRQSPERDTRGDLNRLWRNSFPIEVNDPVGRYLHARVGLTEFPSCLRTVRNARYQDNPPSYHPAMVAMVSAPDGSPCTLHRTYLTEAARKADVPSPRRMMPGRVSSGAAVRLAEPAGELGIAEGIETALSATALTGVPCWAALNASMLAGWAPPSGTQRVVVFADNDANYVGQAAAYALAKKLSEQFETEVRIPERVGRDWNDVYREKCAA